jgi:hypothetical protein
MAGRAREEATTTQIHRRPLDPSGGATREPTEEQRAGTRVVLTPQAGMRVGNLADVPRIPCREPVVAMTWTYPVADAAAAPAEDVRWDAMSARGRTNEVSTACTRVMEGNNVDVIFRGMTEGAPGVMHRGNGEGLGNWQQRNATMLMQSMLMKRAMMRLDTSTARAATGEELGVDRAELNLLITYLGLAVVFMTCVKGWLGVRGGGSLARRTTSPCSPSRRTPCGVAR